MLTLLLGLLLVNEPKLPEAKEIVQRAVQTTLNDREEFERRNLQYTKRVKEYDTSKTPAVLKKSESYRMWYKDGNSWQQLIIDENGRAVINGKIESPGADSFKTLPDRYEFSWHDSPLISFSSCKPCYVIRVSPRKNGFKPKSRAEKVLARMEGFLYIDVDRQFVRYASSTLPKSFRMGFMWVAKVNSASFEFEQRQFGDLVVFDVATVEVSFAFSGKERNLRYEYTYTDYAFEETQTPSQ